MYSHITQVEKRDLKEKKPSIFLQFTEPTIKLFKWEKTHLGGPWGPWPDKQQPGRGAKRCLGGKFCGIEMKKNVGSKEGLNLFEKLLYLFCFYFFMFTSYWAADKPRTKLTFWLSAQGLGGKVSPGGWWLKSASIPKVRNLDTGSQVPSWLKFGNSVPFWNPFLTYFKLSN